jgi:tol-pal system protein YbgF
MLAVVSPEEDPVQIRLKDLDGRVQRIERVLTNQSLMELAQRIDTLQADLRTIRGEVEVLQNQTDGGKSQSRALYGDLEKRLAALETLGGVGAGGAPATGAPPSGAGPMVGAGGEQSSYDAAFNALKGSDYPKAISGFKGFVAAYPSSPLASNAQYWLGEAYYVTREYPSAIAAFQKVTTDWPESRKVPDALVKIGFTQAALGKNGDARVTLQDVVRRFPGSEASQLASDRLKRLPK